MTPRSTGVGARPKYLRSHPSVLETNEHSPADARSILAPLPQHTFPCCSNVLLLFFWDVEKHLKRTDPPLRVHTTEQWQTKQRYVLQISWFNSSRLPNTIVQQCSTRTRRRRNARTHPHEMAVRLPCPTTQSHNDNIIVCEKSNEQNRKRARFSNEQHTETRNSLITKNSLPLGNLPLFS